MDNDRPGSLTDPRRLAVLAASGLLDTPPEEAFDRFTRLAARLLQVPVALVSLVTPDRQFFKSHVGLADPWAVRRETPLSHSFCQYVVQDGQPFVVADARTHPRVQDNQAIPDLDVIAYAGVPLTTPDGMTLGAFCAIDSQPRAWTPEEIALLEDLAAGLRSEVVLRLELAAQQRTAAALRESEAHARQAEARLSVLFRRMEAALTRTQALYRVSRSLTNVENLAALLQAVVDSAATALPADRMTVITLDQAARRIIHLVKGGLGAGLVVAVSYDELEEGLTGWVLREGEPALSPKGAIDPRESPAVRTRRAATECGSIMVAPLVYRDQVLGTMTAINQPTDPDFTTKHLDLLVAMAQQVAVAITQAQLFQDARQQAATDPLTGLANRRGFLTAGMREVGRARRSLRPLAAIAFDLDHFKGVNDVYGHAVGDEVLRAVVARCWSHIREVDLFGRLGGEEFAVLLPDTPIVEAAHVAERLRRAVADTPVQTTCGALPVTVSLGVGGAQGAVPDLAALLAQVDAVLYAAKAAGRNRVVVQGCGA